MTLTADTGRVPTAFTYWEHRKNQRLARVESTVRKLFGTSLFPSDDLAADFCDSLFHGDPVAENFVDEVFAADPKAGRALLDRALVEGIDALDDVPASMRVLFDEFETLPEWVRPELVEQGAAIWRRWGTMLFAVAGGITSRCTPKRPLRHRCPSPAATRATTRYVDSSKPVSSGSTRRSRGALLRIGSTGRATAMKVRVMHVAVRRRIDGHPEWHTEKWGYPISQGYQMLTLLGGSTVPALALRLVGLQTTPSEIRALLHFQKFMGHLLGVNVDNFPTTIADSLRMTAMVSAARSYDAGVHGKELIESFPASFAPRPHQKGLARLRARYNHGIYGAYTTLFMGPATRAKYDMPSAFPWILIVIARFPLITVLELVRRIVPGAAQRMERIADAHRRSWLRAQMDGREAEFDAQGALRR